MKRLISAAAFCLLLLFVEGSFLLTHSSAKDDAIGSLLRLPAPPPPNPEILRIYASDHDSRKKKEPSANAPIDELADFYAGISRDLRTLGYKPDIPDEIFDKLTALVDKDPKKLLEFLGALKDSERNAKFVKEIYDREGKTGALDKSSRQTLKEWLVYHSSYYTDELAERAKKTGDTDTYVNDQEELLQLARFDFERARPMIDQMYANDPSKVSRVLARWALYRHALDTDSSGEIDRYRRELQDVVEDRSLPAPMRDLAMDALVTEKDWSGRDEWYYSLFKDPTLQDLGTYTGLTTLINVSAPGKYNEKMLDMLNSGDPVIRAAVLACGRMIRAKLPVAKAITALHSTDKQLSSAADAFLESEDSPAARSAVLAAHPNEAKILGASTAFFPAVADWENNEFLSVVFSSVYQNSFSYYGWLHQDDELVELEKRLQAEVKKDEHLIGLYAYDSNFIRMYPGRAVYSWEEDESRFRERDLDPSEFDTLQSYLVSNHVDDILPSAQCGGDYCTAKELIMLSRMGGRRVYYSGEPTPFFDGLDKMFEDIRKRPAKVKYALSREIPGLELLLANDELHIETVWMDAGGLKVAATDMQIRERIDKEIDEHFKPNSEDEDDDSSDVEVEKARLRNARSNESISWMSVVSGAAAGQTSQPVGVEFIPLRDSMPVQPGQSQWSARTSTFEIRAGDDALYKISGGSAIKLRAGVFSDPVVTPDGRWAIVSGSLSDDEGLSPKLWRINIATGKAANVNQEDYVEYHPVCYIPSIRRVLVKTGYGQYQDIDDDTVAPDPDARTLFLLDPETGRLDAAKGEFRPLAQQTFRMLQKASLAGTSWAAITDPEKGTTDVGIYDSRTFTFRPRMRIPKIAFNSMSMYVDETAATVYFVYRGQLLKLPLK